MKFKITNQKYLLVDGNLPIEKYHMRGKKNVLNLFSTTYDFYNGIFYGKQFVDYIDSIKFVEINYDFLMQYRKFAGIDEIWGRLYKVRRKKDYDVYTPRQKKLKLYSKPMYCKLVYYIGG